MKQLVALFFAGSVLALAAPAFATDAMHGAMHTQMMPSCAKGDPVVDVNLAHKTYAMHAMHAMKADAMHGGAMHGGAMHGGAMKADAMHGGAMHGSAMHGSMQGMKMMCMSKAKAMGAKMAHPAP